jgi:hypothetical protein
VTRLGRPTLELPEAVRAACFAAPPALAAGQIWRACLDDVARFVLVLVVEPSANPYGQQTGVQSRPPVAVRDAVLVAPVTLDIEMATEEAFLLNADDSDFDIPIAVWLPLRRYIPQRVMDRYAGNLHIATPAIRQAPTGSRLISVLEDRAMEFAVVADDMDELAGEQDWL